MNSIRACLVGLLVMLLGVLPGTSIIAGAIVALATGQQPGQAVWNALYLTYYWAAIPFALATLLHFALASLRWSGNKPLSAGYLAISGLLLGVGAGVLMYALGTRSFFIRSPSAIVPLAWAAMAGLIYGLLSGRWLRSRVANSR